MAEEYGLIFAWTLDGRGGGQPLDWRGLRTHRAGDGLLWVHVNRSMTQVQGWLDRESGLDEVVVEAFTANETRPRCTVIGPGLLLNLRGMDRNPGADADDMATVRLWAEPGRVVTGRRVPVTAVHQVYDSVARGNGPRDLGGFLVAITERIADDVEPEIRKLVELVDDLEEEALASRDDRFIERVGALRQRVNGLRRYLVPQRQAVERLVGARLSWLEDDDRRELHEVAERTGRFVEDLDSVRERALVVTDLLEHRLSLRLTRTMYLLSLVSTLFLPLTFLASLLGMNVGGIPGGGSSWGFAAVSFVMGAILAGGVFLFRRLRWI